MRCHRAKHAASRGRRSLVPVALMSALRRRRSSCAVHIRHARRSARCRRLAVAAAWRPSSRLAAHVEYAWRCASRSCVRSSCSSRRSTLSSLVRCRSFRISSSRYGAPGRPAKPLFSCRKIGGVRGSPRMPGTAVDARGRSRGLGRKRADGGELGGRGEAMLNGDSWPFGTIGTRGGIAPPLGRLLALPLAQLTAGEYAFLSFAREKTSSSLAAEKTRMPCRRSRLNRSGGKWHVMVDERRGE